MYGGREFLMDENVLKMRKFLLSFHCSSGRVTISVPIYRFVSNRRGEKCKSINVWNLLYEQVFTLVRRREKQNKHIITFTPFVYT